MTIPVSPSDNRPSPPCKKRFLREPHDDAQPPGAGVTVISTPFQSTFVFFTEAFLMLSLKPTELDRVSARSSQAKEHTGTANSTVVSAVGDDEGF